MTRAEFLRAGAGVAAVALAAQAAAQTDPTPFDATAPAARIGGPPPRVKGPTDLREFERWIVETFAPSVKLPGGAGNYARKPGEKVELYGVSDMASVFYTLNRLQPDERERGEWAAAFQQFQRPGDGLLVERRPTHDPLHNTAYAIASMQLMDLRPNNPVKVDGGGDPATFLETIDWRTNVYVGSHRGSGLGSIRYLIPELNDPKWFAAYFAKLDTLIDPRNGMMGRGKPPKGDWDQIGGSFHYHFLYELFHRTMAHPEARIDAIIGLRQSDGYWHPLNHFWLTLDAVYMMTRSLRYTTHRFEDVRRVVRETMALMARDIFSPEGRPKTLLTGPLWTHNLMGALSVVAEAQRFLGVEDVITERPLRLVLDRRPFI